MDNVNKTEIDHLFLIKHYIKHRLKDKQDPLWTTLTIELIIALEKCSKDKEKSINKCLEEARWEIASGNSERWLEE